MFYAARVKDDIFIRINYKVALSAVVGLSFSLLFSVWAFWFFALRGELSLIKRDIYSTATKSVGSVVTDSFAASHISLLQYENCKAELMHCEAITKDLSKMVSVRIAHEEK